MERVLNMRVNKTLKLYPYRVVSKVQLINDSISDVPVVIMAGSGYVSPLDKSQITDSAKLPLVAGFDRTVDGTELTFEKSGVDITDTQTGSQWTSFGKAIAGSLRGTQLKRLDSGVNFAFAALAFTPQAEIYVE